MSAAIPDARFLRRAEALAERLGTATLWKSIQESSFLQFAARRFRLGGWISLAVLLGALVGQLQAFLPGFWRVTVPLYWLIPGFALLRLALIGSAASRAAWLLNSPLGRSMMQQCYLAGMTPTEFSLGIGILSAGGAFALTGLSLAFAAPFLGSGGWEFTLLLPFDFVQIVLLQFWCGFHMAEEIVRGRARKPRPLAALFQVSAGYPIAFSMALATPMLALLLAALSIGMIGGEPDSLFGTLGPAVLAYAAEAWMIAAYAIALPVVFVKEIEQQLRALGKADLDFRDCIQFHGSPTA